MLNKIFEYSLLILLNKDFFLYKYIHFFINIYHLYTYKVIFYVNSTLEKYPFINFIILYIYNEYLTIMKGNLSLDVLSIITLFVYFYEDYIQLYFFLLFVWMFKCCLKNNPGILSNNSQLYNFLVDLSSLVIMCLIFFFFDDILVQVLIPFLKIIFNSIINKKYKLYIKLSDILNPMPDNNNSGNGGGNGGNNGGNNGGSEYTKFISDWDRYEEERKKANRNYSRASRAKKKEAKRLEQIEKDKRLDSELRRRYADK